MTVMVIVHVSTRMRIRVRSNLTVTTWFVKLPLKVREQWSMLVPLEITIRLCSYCKTQLVTR
jgi:hypothetical protein